MEKSLETSNKNEGMDSNEKSETHNEKEKKKIKRILR